jgi:hypothetical protein
MEVQKVIIHELIKNQGETSARDFLTNAVLALNEETVNDRVYRIVLASERDRKNHQIPSLGCFSFSPSDDGKLSVD